MAFSDLKKSAASNFGKLKAELNKLNSNNSASYEDTRYWQPAVDSSGNGYAVIRFLPAPDGEDLPFVRMWSHGFKNVGGWYIENCLSTIGKDDPVMEINNKLWTSSMDDPGPERTQARQQGRQLSYHSNVYVVKDPANPENEGKVFLYRYGKKIFDKLNDLMNPEFEDETPIDPFDFWTGANFKLKIRKVEGFKNYDKSEFESPSPLLDNDDDLEAVYKQEHSLKEIIAPANFKDYDTLKSRLDKVLGNSSNETAKTTKKVVEEDEIEEEKTPAPKLKEKKTEVKDAVEDDDDYDFFKGLAEDD